MMGKAASDVNMQRALCPHNGTIVIACSAPNASFARFPKA